MLYIQLYFYSDITKMIDLVRLNDNGLWSWDCWEGFNAEGFSFWIPALLFPFHYRMDWLPTLTDIKPTSELTLIISWMSDMQLSAKFIGISSYYRR